MVFGFVVEVDLVLFDLLIGQFVAVQVVQPVLGTRVLALRLQLPVLTLEPRQLRHSRLLPTHLIINFIALYSTAPRFGALWLPLKLKLKLSI